jgi:predicted GNAT family N-acyltransferase
MLRIELLSWENARSRATPIRFEVFVKEQGVPAAIELDEADARSIHALAFDGSQVVGTARLLPDGHIGRMAVLKQFRGKGIGSALLVKLVEAAKQRGERTLVLSAQVHAVDFYRAHGFRPQGEVYEEAGIAHQDMRRSI